MCRLGLSVICTDTCFTVTSDACPMIQACSCVLGAPGCFYSWDLLQEGPGAIADILITNAYHCMQNQAEILYMPTDDLHCTVRMSYDGQLAEVEEVWLWYDTCYQLIVGSRCHNPVSVFTMLYPNIPSEKGTG